jgi:hypothetical protein
MQQSAVRFERDIRLLLCDEDVQSMSSASDPSSYDDGRAAADKTVCTVADGSMSCDDPWPAVRVGLFGGWADAGCGA